jgi:phage gpG-like protein
MYHNNGQTGTSHHEKFACSQRHFLPLEPHMKKDVHASVKEGAQMA